MPGGSNRLPATFAYHDGATVRLVALMLLVYVPVEALVLGSLVSPGDWWVRVLHAVTWLAALGWIWSYYFSMRRRPHRISAAGLELHNGFWSAVQVPAESVESMELLPEPADGISELVKLPAGVVSLTVRGVPEVELKLASPVRPTSLLGRRPTSRVVRISVNDRVGFQAAVMAARAEARRDRGLT